MSSNRARSGAYMVYVNHQNLSAPYPLEELVTDSRAYAHITRIKEGFSSLIDITPETFLDYLLLHQRFSSFLFILEEKRNPFFDFRFFFMNVVLKSSMSQFKPSEVHHPCYLFRIRLICPSPPCLLINE